jgi:hypothetical protein
MFVNSIAASVSQIDSTLNFFVIKIFTFYRCTKLFNRNNIPRPITTEKLNQMILFSALEIRDAVKVTVSQYVQSTSKCNKKETDNAVSPSRRLKEFTS